MQKPKCKCPNRYLGKGPVAITTSSKQQHNPFNQNMELKGAQLLWGPAGTGDLYSVFINVSCTKHLYSDLLVKKRILQYNQDIFRPHNDALTVTVSSY